MKQTTRIALAALVHSLGAACQAFAVEISGSDEAAPATPEPPKERKKRGAAAAVEAAVAEPADPVTPASEPAEETATGGKTYDELKAIIKPLVENNQGEDVKKVIAKYATNLKDLESKPQHHAAFEKDIAALAY